MAFAPAKFRPASAAESGVGTTLLIAIVVVLAAIFAYVSLSLHPDTHVPVESGGKATFTSEGYYLEPSGPDAIPVGDSTLFITIDGAQAGVPLSTFAATIGSTNWNPGQRICIVGAAADCYAALGRVVQVTAYSHREFIFSVEALRSQTPAFAIGSNGVGGVTVQGGTWDVKLTLVGAQITCGASGPDIPVTAKYTLNGGTTYTPLLGGVTLNQLTQQTTDLGQVASGSVLGVQGRANSPSCGGFDRTYDSLTGSPHVLLLRQGDPAPNRPAFGSQASLASFMQPYVNTYTHTMILDPNQVILLYEFTDDLNSAAADFQDLVVLFTFA